ncbi:MAG: hypothetical protein ACXWFJ_01325, partial [Candidatus Aminicenantales bacterium]
MFKMKKLKIDPIIVLIMAVIAALPFLLFRVFPIGARSGAGAAAGSFPAPALSQSLTDDDSAWVQKTLAGLTLERKIAQIVTADVVGGYIPDDDPRLARWIELAHDHGVGMFVFYGGTPRDVAHLLNRLQKAAA